MQKKLFKLRVIEPFRAKKLSSNGKSVLYKPFSYGNTITAFEANISSTPGNFVNAFKTADGFIIPLIYVQVLGQVGGPVQKERMSKFSGIEEAQVIEDKPKTDTSLFKGIKNLKVVDNLKQKSKAGTNGALVGAGLGLIYAFAKQKNKYLLVTIGAVGGFVIGNAFTNLIKDDNKK